MVVLERIELQQRARVRGAREVGGLYFQRWLAKWKADGNADILVAVDGSHALAVAKPGTEASQLSLEAAS